MTKRESNSLGDLELIGEKMKSMDGLGIQNSSKFYGTMKEKMGKTEMPIDPSSRTPLRLN